MFFRKHRRSDDNAPVGESSHRPGLSANPSPFSVIRSLTRSPTVLGDGTKAPKGPLGLSLLHSPADPRVDLIFVHGLGGDSRKTWSKTSTELTFWPQDWLPNDLAFSHVRIHSYGYDSNYMKGKEDCLNIHHMGKSFLGELSTSPQLMDSKTHIVAIGHSMGGLVIKKAFILAKHDAAHRRLADRIASIYFLATPHRGADSAKMLKNLLKAVYDRAYIGDLERNSTAIQVINDEFRHVSEKLELWSFYETQHMKHFSSLIVDPESAILGYREEKQIPMNADHRSICKFETVSDPNYTILRNALASTLSRITTTVLESQPKEIQVQIKDIKDYLDVSDGFEDDLIAVTDARIRGSCQWISDKDVYLRWRDGEPENGQVLWIKSKPATGKSVLAGHIICDLQNSGQNCSYFFFKYGDKSKSKLDGCLRALAFQMACTSVEARDVILGMKEDGVLLERLDERTIWRLLFTGGIFKTKMSQQFWVIDAVDESAHPSIFFDAILPKITASLPLRVVFTSRDAAGLGQGISDLPEGLLLSLPMSATDTLSDLKMLIELRTNSLSVVEVHERAILTERMLKKSKGSFLWTNLVLGELLNCHSKKEIDHILEDVPKGMMPLYKRMIQMMSQTVRGKELAKAVLLWAACAIRPLTVTELGHALGIDLGDSFPKLAESIIALCGQLVLVDKYERIQLVHETAREFLFSNDLESEFAIKSAVAHTRIARVCLQYLIGDEMKPPRTVRRQLATKESKKRAEFANYAITAFSYHLSRANPQAADVFQLVSQFARSNILSWIEEIAKSRDFRILIQVSRHLGTYISVCSVERSPLDLQIQSLKQWTVDLVRIATKFGNALILSPSAIYSLIPPFCPTGSMIYSTSSRRQNLTLLGTSSEQWDDRLSCIDFRQSQPSALCYGGEFLMIGLVSGMVKLYDDTSYQEQKSFDHGESVKFIRFQSRANQIATCGMKMIKIWDLRSGELMHSLKSPPGPLDIAFDNDSLLVASQKNYLQYWTLKQEAIENPKTIWRDSSGTNATPRRPPGALAISVSQKMLAVSYSGQPITLWDLEESEYFGSCGKMVSGGDTSTHVVVALAFNPNPSIGLLAVSYLDGDLAVLDPFENRQVECFRAGCHTLSPSPDGRLLAAGAANGIIHIYEFDTLNLLYKVKSSNSHIKQIGFSRDGLRFAEIRASQCTIWEPTALPRHILSDDSSGTTLASTVNAMSLDSQVKITAIAVHDKFDTVFCGTEDGKLLLYSLKSATCLQRLYSHKSQIRILRWCHGREIVLSVDVSNRIFCYNLQNLAHGKWSKNPIFQCQLESDKAIIDLLTGGEEGKFLVSTRESDHLFTKNGILDAERRYTDKLVSRKWMPHPTSSEHLICIENATVGIYSWADWSWKGSFLIPAHDWMAQLAISRVSSLATRRGILLEFSKWEDSTRTSEILLLNATQFELEHSEGDESQSEADAQRNKDVASLEETTHTFNSSSDSLLGSQLQALARVISHVIGIKDERELVFIDRSSWVCSIDLGGFEGRISKGFDSQIIGYSRHCFIPYDWFAGQRDIICTIARNNLIFARNGELAILKGCFDYNEGCTLKNAS